MVREGCWGGRQAWLPSAHPNAAVGGCWAQGCSLLGSSLRFRGEDAAPRRGCVPSGTLRWYPLCQCLPSPPRLPQSLTSAVRLALHFMARLQQDQPVYSSD